MSLGAPLCLVRGSINIDEFFHVKSIVRPGETLSSTRYERRAGGKGANQAVAVAQAGAQVVLVGAVGSDGGWLLHNLQDLGVDTSKIATTHEEPTGRAVIQLTPQGENSIILHRGANFLNVASLAQPEEAPYTHLLLQNEIPFETTLTYLSHSRRHGKISFFNPSPLPTKDQIRAFPWEDLDWLIVNEGEAFDLLENISAGSGTVAIDGIGHAEADRADRVASAGRRLQDLRAHPSFSRRVNIICTLGPVGALALIQSPSGASDDEIIHVSAANVSPHLVLDTTGAGDCFTGYLVAGLMELQPLEGLEGTVRGGLPSRDGVESVLQRCVAAAGLCVQQLGAMESIPSRAQVDNALRS